MFFVSANAYIKHLGIQIHIQYKMHAYNAMMII